MKRFLSFFLLLFVVSNCAPYRLAGYALFPDYPVFDGNLHQIAGLHAPVHAAAGAGGLWHIRAENEHDLMFITGYLQARDRFAQMDVFRHLAHGRVSELTGAVPFGEKSSVEADLYNRALRFAAQGRFLYDQTSAEERLAIDAFAAGINAWIAEGHRPLEHRLLGVNHIAPWTVDDSLAIYQMIMYSLSSNANREIRRLLLACEISIDAAERIWPSDINFKISALPEENHLSGRHIPAPAIVPELHAEMLAQCSPASETTALPSRAARPQPADATPLAFFASSLSHGWSASNSWVVGGSRTASGKPVLANDPHLPHMNPPIVWGIDQQVPRYRTAGFTLPGVHRVAFGHNGFVAWSATTNHVDRQDLVVLRPALVDAEGRAQGYEYEGKAIPFTIETLEVRVKGQAARTFQVRYGVDGPVINDIELSLPGRIPLTTLRQAPQGAARDLDAARALSHAQSAADFIAAIRMMDAGCTNWVYATAAGDIGYESPCLLPVRNGYSGAFPVPGWLSKYDWAEFVDKAALPASLNPAQGWLASANSRVVPPESFPTAHNNDPSEPNRYERVAELLEARTHGYTKADAAAMQMDIQDAGWPRIKAVLDEAICQDESVTPAEARKALCAWDGASASDSYAATLFVLLSNALLDRALADEIPGGAQNPLWAYVQSIPMFEANVHWLWIRPASDPVWNDVTTQAQETKQAIIRTAFDDAVGLAQLRYGKNPAHWQWGKAAPFRVRHLFATGDGVLGALVNSHELPGIGAPTTLYKNQFNRSDRERYRASLGPSVRFVIDMAEPWNATYTLAGGQSGWPRSPHFNDAVGDWRHGAPRALTPEAIQQTITFTPADDAKRGAQ
jgi:penicillin G amidase